jgi:hypothetical protein
MSESDASSPPPPPPPPPEDLSVVQLSKGAVEPASKDAEHEQVRPAAALKDAEQLLLEDAEQVPPSAALKAAEQLPPNAASKDAEQLPHDPASKDADVDDDNVMTVFSSPHAVVPDEVSCSLCRSPECFEDDEIVICDGCELAVHQCCYGGLTPIPEGEWFCAPCRVKVISPKCEICNLNTKGAFKRTEEQGWAHIICVSLAV